MTSATMSRRTFLTASCVEAGRIELQAHDAGKWIDYKEVKIRRL